VKTKLLVLLFAAFPCSHCLTVTVRDSAQVAASDSLLQAADSLFLRGKFSDAEGVYKSLADERNDPRGYIGLGKLLLVREDWGESRHRFDKALELDPTSVEAHYDAAVSYRETGRWRSGGNVYQAQGISQEAAYARSMECFRWLLQHDSTYQDLLYQYALLLKDQGRFGDAIGALCEELRLRPDLLFVYPALARLCRAAIDQGRGAELLLRIPPRFRELETYVRAEMQMREARLDEAQPLLWQSVRSSREVPPQLAYRALFRIFAARGELGKLDETCWKAVAEINNEAGAALLFEDLKYIATPQEMGEYFTSTTEQKRERFFASFWNRRNPTLGSPSNPRLGEHYQRLLYAEQNYASDRERYSLYYSRGFLGLNFELEDIGRVYVRLGPPSELTMGSSPSTVETWRYEATAEGPEMAFHFAGAEKSFSGMAALSDGPEQQVGHDNPKLPRSRVMGGETFSFQSEGMRDVANLFPPDAAFWDPMYFYLTKVKAVDKSSIVERIAEESRRSVTEGLTTERHTIDEKLRTLHLPNAISAFRDGKARTDLEVSYVVPGNSLLKESGDTLQSLDVESGFALYDKRWRKITSVAETLEVTRAKPASSTYIRFHQLLVKPDTYYVGIYAHPLGVNLLAKSEETVAAPDFWGSGFGISDLQLAFEIRKATEFSIFNKEGLRVAVNPLRTHSINRPLYVYFEIYNPTKTADGGTELTLDLDIRPVKSGGGILSGIASLFGQKKGFFVSSEVERWKTDGALARYLVMDVTRMDPGQYVLEVKVTDRALKKTVSRSVSFELVGKRAEEE